MSESSMAKRIRELRQARNLTLEQVADVVGVGKSTVRKWETGMIANMRRDKIAALAKVLGTTPAYLMGWKEELPEKENTPDELQLTEGEITLLEIFRLIPEDQQKVFLDMGRVYANSLKKE